MTPKYNLLHTFKLHLIDFISLGVEVLVFAGTPHSTTITETSYNSLSQLIMYFMFHMKYL